MKRKAFIYSCVPVILAVLILAVLLVKPRHEFLFRNAQGDCNARSNFMYNALYNNPYDPEVIFVGSSKTMNGINDSLMSSIGKQNYLNLGYCRFGRNLDYFFINEYCKKHHPKHLVLEVREREGENSHPVAPFFLPLGQLLAPAFSLNGSFFPDLYNKWLCNLKFIRETLFNTPAAVIIKQDPRQGYFYVAREPDHTQIMQQRHKDSITIAGWASNNGEPLNRNAKLYFNKIKALCEAKHIQLHLLYLSSYANLCKRPLSYDSYRQYGRFLSVPDSLLQNIGNFYDGGHFNARGANANSRWLLSQLE